MAQARKLKSSTGEEIDDTPLGSGGASNFPEPQGDETPQFPGPPDVSMRDYPTGGPINDGLTTGRGEETPRDRMNPVAPRKPMSPNPMAANMGGSGFQSPGPIPFNPLPSPVGGPGNSRLFGSMGGLKGGGLGIPLDPVSDVASDPINTLIQMLMKRG